MLRVFYFKSENEVYNYSIRIFLESLIDALLKTNRFQIYLIHLFDSSVDELCESTTEQNFHQIRIPSPLYYVKTIKNDQLYANRVVDLIAKHIDGIRSIIHINHFIECDIANIIKSRFNCPIVNSVHSVLLQTILNGNSKRISEYIREGKPKHEISIFNKEATLNKLSDIIVTVNQEQKTLLMDFYDLDENKIEIIRRGTIFKKVSITKKEKINLKKRYFINLDKKIILYVGRVDRSKGLHNLIEAVKLLNKEKIRARLIIAGEGDMEIISRAIGNYWAVITHVFFLSKNELLNLYKIADIGVLPHVYDNDSIVAKEMTSHGLPLVLSNCIGFKEIFSHKRNCLMARNNTLPTGEQNINVNELATNIKLLLENEDVALEINGHCVDDVLLKESFENTAIRYEGIYRSIL